MVLFITMGLESPPSLEKNTQSLVLPQMPFWADLVIDSFVLQIGSRQGSISSDGCKPRFISSCLQFLPQPQRWTIGHPQEIGGAPQHESAVGAPNTLGSGLMTTYKYIYIYTYLLCITDFIASHKYIVSLQVYKNYLYIYKQKYIYIYMCL